MATREGELFVEKIEVNLDGRQIFCLFCGGAVIASLVFVLGVTVGRRVEAREHPDPIAAASAVDSLAALDQMAAEESSGPELAFASTLRGEREGDPLGPVDLSLDRSPASRTPALKLAAARPEPPAGEGAKLAAAPKLVAAKPAPPPQGASAEAARLEAARLGAMPASAAAKPSSASAAAKPSSASAAAKPSSASPAAKPSSASPAAKPEAVLAAAKPVGAQVAPAAGAVPAEVSADAARFTLHLSSYQERAEADVLVGRLKKAGYQPYVVETPEEGKGTWYRVRVGRYASYEDAVAGKVFFEKKQGIIAYVTRTRR